MPEETLSLHRILQNNLQKNGSALLCEEEKRLGHLFDASEWLLGTLLPKEGPIDPSSLLIEASLRTDTSWSVYGVDSSLPENRAFLSFFGEKLSAFDRIGFTECFASSLEKRLGRPLTLYDFPEGVEKRPKDQRVLFVKNAYADLSFNGFSSLLPMARPLLRPSFRAVCDDLENGLGDYAILPLFSGGKELPAVSSLLSEYGFAIAALIRPATEEEEPPVFALLTGKPVTLGEAELFGFRFFPKKDEDTTALLSAIDRLLLSVREIATLPTATLPGYRVTVRGDEKKFVLLLTYLTLFVKDFSSLGFYSEVKKGKRSL